MKIKLTKNIKRSIITAAALCQVYFVFAKNGAVLCRQRGPRLLKFAKYNNYEYDVGRVVVVAESAERSISQSEGRGSNPLIGKIYC